MFLFRNKRLFLILLSLILLVVLVGYSLNNRENLTKPEQFASDFVGAIQYVIHKPTQLMTNLVTNIKDLKVTFDENKILREELAEYQTLIYDLQKLEEENKNLKKTLDKTESISDFTPIQATVITRSPERWMEQLTLNKGSKAGVKDNMAVITADGMIGKISSTSSFTSTVQLVSGFDQFNRISAKIVRKDKKDIFGVIEQYDREEKLLLFKIIETKERNIKEGDLVLSSGMGGLFPADLVIGKVVDIVPDPYGLTQTALVEPAADLYNIDHVIIVDRSLPGDEDDEVDKAEEETEEEQEDEAS